MLIKEQFVQGRDCLPVNRLVSTLCMLGNFSCFCWRLLTFFKINFFNNFFQEYYQHAKLFWSRWGPTFCHSWSGSKLFAKVISRWQKLQPARKEFILGLMQEWTKMLEYAGKNFGPKNFVCFFHLLHIFKHAQDNFILEATSMHLHQTVSKEAVWSEFILFAI